MHDNGKSRFIDDSPINTYICRGFPIVMFDYQRVCISIRYNICYV